MKNETRKVQLTKSLIIIYEDKLPERKTVTASKVQAETLETY